jgi:hypothetical protein
MVSQSVCLGIKHPCGTCDQILLTVRMLLSEICGLASVAHPLWREDGSAVCSVITQWSESLRTCNHNLLSHLRLPQPEGPGYHIYIPQEQGVPVIPLALGSLYFVSYNSQGSCGGILTLPNLEGQFPLYISFRYRMIQSNVKVTLWPAASHSILVPSPLGIKGFHPNEF